MRSHRGIRKRQALARSALSDGVPAHAIKARPEKLCGRWFGRFTTTKGLPGSAPHNCGHNISGPVRVAWSYAGVQREDSQCEVRCRCQIRESAEGTDDLRRQTKARLVSALLNGVNECARGSTYLASTASPLSAQHPHPSFQLGHR